MFIKSSITTLIIAVISTVCFQEYYVTTYTDLKVRVMQLKDTCIETFVKLGLMANPILEKSIKNKENRHKTEISKLFTEEELAKYTGENGSTKLYLAILGKVYDVGAGRKHYGPGGGYHFFTGRDASRAFVTGDFSDSGLTDDVTGLSPAELKSLLQWDEFYVKEYKYKGKLIGRYYDSNGEKTSYNVGVGHMIEEAKRAEETENEDKIMFPPCNVEWSQESGSRVWCSTMSGGIQRDWVGVPRQLYVPGSETYRCACIKNDESTSTTVNKAQLKEYSNCNAKSISCNT